ncbi:Cytochrome P450, partial [Russula decolorans]
IPTAGFSDPIFSYFSAAQFTFDGIRMLKEGYEKTRPGLFKIASFRRWIVLATGPQLIDDIRRAPDDVLSLLEPANEFLQPDYTLKLLDAHDEYHTDIIRAKLTRDVAGTFKDVHEELVMAMDDLIPTDGHSRDEDYQTLNLTFAINVLKFGFIISLFPKSLKPIASRMLSNLPSQTQQQIEFLRPMVEERLAKMEEYGEHWDDKPNDMLMWLMSEAKGVERSLEGWARRLLLVNVIGIHSTALAMYRLLANPEYIEPLRQEVDAVIREDGWTKAGIDKMHKIDSFLRETQRIDSFTALAVNRCAMRPFTFSNGVTVPAGTFVSVPANAAHRDERIYSNADKFDGFRFTKLRESEGDTTTSRYQAVSVSNEHLPFGLGRHTWQVPGRFFAVYEMKALLAHIVVTYDIKFAEGSGVPRELFLSGLRYPGKADHYVRDSETLSGALKTSVQHMGTLIQAPASMLDDYTLKVSFLGGFLVVVAFFASRYFSLGNDPGLYAIPTIGFSHPILSYFSAARYVFDSIRILKGGYEKTKPGLFKVATFRRWMVLATGSQLIEDVRRAPDNVLSRAEPLNEFIQAEYTLDLLNPKDRYTPEVIRSKLTRDIAGTFQEVRDELVVAMDDLVPAQWVNIPLKETVQRVICRTTNRIFVGVPLCRDQDYQNLILNYAGNVLKVALIITWFPKPLKAIVFRIVSNLSSQIQRKIEFIRPLVEERFAKMEEYGKDWDDKPNDMLMWLMSEAKGVERSVEGIARRLLVVNLAAIMMTSHLYTITQILYHLLANPEYIEPLRQEVDAVIGKEGWTKAGIDKMHKIDSFLRETQRLGGSNILVMDRLVLRPFTFSNGVTVPAGTLISVPSNATHTDERIFSNPDKFDGFRFTKLRESEGDTTTSRYQAVATSGSQLSFGQGRNACPGRFFAVNEIKTLVAYIVVTYDMKFEEGKGVPRENCIAGMRIPGSTNVMFRYRQK